MTDFTTAYEGVRRIRSLILTTAESASEDLWMELRRDGPNPFYRQMAHGLYLELYYGLPNTLWTPWGKYLVGGSGSGDWRPTVEALLPRLGATCTQEGRDTEWGHLGPYFELTRVDGFELPTPRIKSRAPFTPYDRVKENWALLRDRLGPVEGACEGDSVRSISES